MKNIPMVALKEMTMLPGMLVNFDVSRQKSIKAIEAAMRDEQKIFIATQKDPAKEQPAMADLYEYGLVAEIKQIVKLQKNVVRVLVIGQVRARLVSFELEEPYVLAKVSVESKSEKEQVEDISLEAMLREIKDMALGYCKLNDKIGKSVSDRIEQIDELEDMIYHVANSLPFRNRTKLQLLATKELDKQAQLLMDELEKEIDIFHIRQDLQIKVKERIDKNQREYVLKEQLKLIREELGEEDEDSEIMEFQRQVESLEASEEVKEKLKKEIKHLNKLSPTSSESAVTRGYIETLLALPWDKTSEDNNDLDNAAKILAEDHYGLEKVKERILEFLAVRNLTAKGDSPILCLVGPPGTGKTSIARSVAKALNKKYERISLGGVHDEAEIRGHRKTYVGAMPGRIVNALKNAGVKNPLLLLDEIDKVSRDYKGDTFSALLEVCDSEQNCKFRDHYVELPVDLSQVLFIATANSLETIPRPLLDRMEIIELSSYLETEKLHIAKDHLLEKQIQKHGLKKKQLTITDAAMSRIIRYYTKEAGVRGCERQIAKVCRKAAKEIYEDEKKTIKITKTNLEEYLGKEKYRDHLKNDSDEVGVVRGLAWTSVGGVTLEVEVNVMPGKGQLKLTGQLGDVMKESAYAALSYVRSQSKQYKIEKDFFAEHDIHIHIPEGAVPKDGPSAGITMTTALLSAVTGIKVRANLSMTGEVTLRGRVLPIGGLKEKLLAAKNAKIDTVCVPKKNENDVLQVPDEVTDGMNIIYVSEMSQVLKAALIKE
ncbi:endopeptidase La [Eubacterium oxidoreducens]|nr:endopeptidase La [Eubacterium oxidoreducens]